MFDAWQIMSQQEWQQLNLVSHLQPCSVQVVFCFILPNFIELAVDLLDLMT